MVRPNSRTVTKAWIFSFGCALKLGMSRYIQNFQNPLDSKITISIHFAYENGQFAAFLSAVGRCFPTTTKPSTISKALSRAAMRSDGVLCQGRHSNRPNSQNAWLEVAKFTTKLDYEFTINQQKWGLGTGIFTRKMGIRSEHKKTFKHWWRDVPANLRDPKDGASACSRLVNEFMFICV